MMHMYLFTIFPTLNWSARWFCALLAHTLLFNASVKSEELKFRSTWYYSSFWTEL